LERQEELIENLIKDVNHIRGIVKTKSKMAFVYVLPKEKNNYLEYSDFIKKRIGLNLEIYSVNDKKIYDPERKSKKTKPDKPAIYLE